MKFLGWFEWLLRGAKPDFIFRELFDQIAEEIETLELNATDRKAWEELYARKRVPPGADASLVYRSEIFLLRRVEVPELRLRVMTLRELLKGVISCEAFASFKSSLIPDLKTCNDRTQLLTEAAVLASRVFRRYALVPTVEFERATLVLRMAAWLFLVSVAIYFVFRALGVPIFYFLVLTCGAAGAAISVTRRLYQLDPKREPLLTWLSVEQGRRSLYLSPVLGASFALVFLFVIRANFLSGDLFPDFSDPIWLGMRVSEHGCKNMDEDGVNLRNHAEACSHAFLQYAKVAVWAFIAGWAERMVPDVLNRLSQQTRSLREKLNG